MTQYIVKTKYGLIQGKSGKTSGNILFLGVPFAKPPVDNLRYRPPQEPDYWAGVKNCSTYAPACVQQMRPGEDFPISEDCLYLNIYKPNVSEGTYLPVMFWIHGGAFRGGRTSDPEFNGEALAKKGVIVVTAAYRLSALGFFSTEELEAKTGGTYNLGLLDQLAALRWVMENIRAFGGDSQRITVFGQSAGGISTRMHLVSPLSRGLFTRAIIQSGGGLNEADLVRPKQEFQSLCQKCLDTLGWNTSELFSQPASVLVSKLELAAKEVLQGKELALFQPFVDHCVLPDVPGICIRNGDYAQIPIICGTVSGDAWMFSRKVQDRIPQGKRDAYMRGFALSPSQAWGQLQVNTGRPSIYTYYMDRKQPPKSDGLSINHVRFGSDTPHTSEIAYIFGTLDTRSAAYQPYDKYLSELMMSYWTNFAAYGDPNGSGLPLWPIYARDTYASMHFGQDKIGVEKLIQGQEEKHVIAYTIDHPGMLCSF